MMNFKVLILSTSLSVLCGLYSIYSIILYFEKSKKYHDDEIDTLKRILIQINKKHELTNKKYNELLIEVDKIRSDLSKTIANLETNKIEIINCDGSQNYDTSLNYITDDITDDVIYNAEIKIPKININLINLSHNGDMKLNYDEELRENVQNDSINNIDNSLTIEEKEHDFEILEQGYSNNEHIVRSRSRGTSISEINWAAVTKKFIFG